MRTETEIHDEYAELINSENFSSEEERRLVAEANSIGRRMYWMLPDGIQYFKRVVVTESIGNRSDDKGLA